MPRLALLLPALLLINGCCTKAPQAVLAASTAPAEARLVGLMAQRLVVSRDVAWIKFQNDTPVRDAKREAELLNSLAAQAGGVPQTEVARFFRAQIRASCEVQYELIHGWKRGTTLPTWAPRDLRTQIRPQLDTISAEMLRILPQIRGKESPGLASYAYGVLRSRGFSWRVAGMASGAL